MGPTRWARNRVGDARTAVRQLGAGRLLFTLLFIGAALLLARFSWDVPLAIDAERALYDWRHVMTAPKVDQDDRIVMIVYTDETLAATGKRSPLDRSVLAKALKRIDGFGAKAIGIDILIGQPQPEDPVLVAALKSMKTPTHLAYASATTAEDKIKDWEQAFLDELHENVKPGNVQKTSIVIEADDDNVLRSWPGIRRDEPERIPTAMIGAPDSPFASYEGSVIYRVPRFLERPVFATIPIDTFAEDAIFANPEAADLFRQQVVGKYVLIGGHIQDIDLFETPLNKLTGKPTWGVEIFAHMVAQQLDNWLPMRIPGWAHWIAALAVIAGATATAASNIRPLGLGIAIVMQFAAMVLIPFGLQAQMVDTQGLSAFGWLGGWGFGIRGSRNRRARSRIRTAPLCPECARAISATRYCS
jgi:adenylate cyclase